MSYQPPPQDPYGPPIVPGSPAPLPQPYVPQAFGPYPPQPMYPQTIVVAQPPTSSAATASLVFGILGILGGWCLIGIPCILAVIFGHMGLAQTRTGAMGGRGSAVAGLILGYLVVGPAIALFFLVVAGGIVGSGTPDPSLTPSP